tara:strand:- start:102 stop:602 length:501 start_codon:yes stop_codon:yes gene_type:complete
LTDKSAKNIKGRPKIDWGFHYFDDIDLKKLDKLKNKQIKKINSLNHKISNIEKLVLKYNASKKIFFGQVSTNQDQLDRINRAIVQKSKVYTKDNDSITLITGKDAVRGKISYFGKELWCYVGSNKNYGLVHKRKRIGRMSHSELCDEFRNKIKTKIETSWITKDSV